MQLNEERKSFQKFSMFAGPLPHEQFATLPLIDANTYKDILLISSSEAAPLRKAANFA